MSQVRFALLTGLFVLATAGCITAKNTAPLPGDLHKFDPIAAFPAMAAHAGPEARLVSLRAMFVAPDGTMDLAADYHPSIDATFVTRATQSDVEDQGPVAPGSGFKLGDDLSTRLTVRAPATYHVSSGGSEWDEKHLGMDRDPGSKASGDERFAEPPRCSFAALWKDSIAAGAPQDVVAIIQYDSTGYEFRANGRDFSRRFDEHCAAVES